MSIPYVNHNSLKKIVLLIASFFFFGIAQSQEWQSTKVQLANGILDYPSDQEMNRIPDFSYAGYKAGLEEIPTIEVKKVIHPVDGDNTSHIQNAINKIAELPLNSNGFRGTLLLSSGVYQVYGSILINASGIVLRGAGDGEDEKNNSIIIAKGNFPQKRSVIIAGGGKNTKWIGKVPETITKITSNFIQVGSFSFEVEDTSSYQVGDNIIIHHPATKAWMDAIGQQHWNINEYNITYNRNITKINKNTIYLDAPVYNHLDRSLSQSYIYKYDREGLLDNIGIEDIRIKIEHTDTLEQHARNALLFQLIDNSWVKNSTFLHFSFSGVLTETATFITVENCNALEPKGLPKGGRFYNFNAGNASNNILFKNCVASGARHAFVANGTTEASGIVIYRCTSIDPLTSSEGHRHWTTGMLFDNFRDKGALPESDGGRVLGFYNRGDYGTYHGWTNAHSVIWNSDLRRKNGKAGKAVIQKPRTAQNYAIGSFGIFTSEGPFPGSEGHIEGIGRPLLSPASLYEAQLEARRLATYKAFSDAIIVDSERDIFDYPLLFKNLLLLKKDNRSFGAYTVYNLEGEKVEENVKGPSSGIGQKLSSGIYNLHINLEGRIIERKIIKW